MVQDWKGAVLMGISRTKVMGISFMLAVLLAGLSGFLYVFLYAPSVSKAMDLSLRAFAIVALGGIGHFGGILISGFSIGLLEAFIAKSIGPQWSEAGTYLLLFLVLTTRKDYISR
jgi:branched-chain amino acid transport system permease protein